MKYIKIKNQNEIEIEALTLLGASTKRGQSDKIGYFGSGNKFALAYLLRNDYEVKIFSGKTEIEIETKPVTLHNQSFDRLVINGELTSITTEFGAKWELWQAMRELISNSKDEGGASVEFVDSIMPVKNETHIYIRVRPEIT